jgi:hypothetical protein
VSIATLAWTIYNDQRNRASEAKVQAPEEESVARQVRIALREQDTVLPSGTERITEVVVGEIIRQSKQSR